MDKIEFLTRVLTTTGDVMEGIKRDQRQLPTLCPEYKVEDLVNHMVGWLQVFDADCNGRSFDRGAATYHCKIHPATEFNTAATSGSPCASPPRSTS